MDLVSREAYQASWRNVLLRGCADWNVMPPEVWCEEIRRLQNGQRFKWSYAPYLKKPFQSIFDPGVYETVLQMFSRAGKSEIVLNAMGYCIDQQPRKILVMWPTLGDAEKWSKDALMGELIEPTDSLSRILGGQDGKRRSDNTILHKLYPGGLINIFGANSPGAIRRTKGDFIDSDEIDAIADTLTDEGDPLDILNKRGDEYPDCLRVTSSYPSLVGKSRIAKKLADSDCQKYFPTCVRCGGEPFVMERSMIRFEEGKPETARLECPRCGEFLDDSERYKMMMQGEYGDLWKGTLPFTGRRGFHANSLLWPHPVNKEIFPGGYLQMLAKAMIDAEKADNPDRSRRVIVNTCDAEPFTPTHMEKVESSILYARREDWKGQIPEEVLFVVAGADVHSDRIEVEAVGLGLDDMEYGLGYHVFRGSPLSPHVWDELDKFLITADFETSGGRHLKISGCGVDSGYQTTAVYKFCRARLSRKIYAFAGSPILGKPITGKPTRKGRPPVLLYEIGTNEAKDIIYQRLELTPEKDPSTGEIIYPYGYMHYPQMTCYNEGYFKMLTVENSFMKRASDGQFYKAFECPKGERNEALDIRVYAKAVKNILRPNLEAMAEALAQQACEPERVSPQTQIARPYQLRTGRGWKV